jgi:cobalt-precorrin-7 (C5)-methyltransferase
MIYVIGIGPGHRNYILPKAIETIKQCDMIIGAKRNLDSVREECRQTLELKNNFDEIKKYIIKNSHKMIGVIVSGDAGFYSLLAYVKRHVDEERIEVIPGISSLQYMFSKMKTGYENSKWTSYHGREGIAYNDMVSGLLEGMSFAILTDAVHTPESIRKELLKVIKVIEEPFFLKDITVTIGECLSYEDERITKQSITKPLNKAIDPLCVMVIMYEG